jgi:hypothetical protein
MHMISASFVLEVGWRLVDTKPQSYKFSDSICIRDDNKGWQLLEK